MMKISALLIVLLSFRGTTAQIELPPLDGFSLLPCVPDPSVIDAYTPPYKTMGEVEMFLDSQSQLGGRQGALETFVPGRSPKTAVVVVGGSTGIGRILACHFAEQGSTVISLASTLPEQNDPVSAIDCAAADSIYDFPYDITKSSRNSRRGSRRRGGNIHLSVIMRQLNIDYIDLLLLNAGRDQLGALRDWEASDMQRAYMNNVFGLHDVWSDARGCLNPNGAVVLGVSSVAAETRFLSRRYIYHMTKHALKDLIHGYAVEERDTQPNTRYAVVLQNDAKTNFALKRGEPQRSKCDNEFDLFGQVSNALLQAAGMSPVEVSTAYHQIYAYLAVLQAGVNQGQEVPIAAFPQVFEVSATTITPTLPLKNAVFNNRVLPTEVTNQCFDQIWSGFGAYLMAGCPDPLPPLTPTQLLCETTGEALVPFADPTVVMSCAPDP